MLYMENKHAFPADFACLITIGCAVSALLPGKAPPGRCGPNKANARELGQDLVDRWLHRSHLNYRASQERQ
jgi:hypothetical protein